MDNIIEKFIYVLIVLVASLIIYYMYIDLTTKEKTTNNRTKTISNINKLKKKYKKKIIYNDYYENPDYIRSGEILDDYIPTKEEVEEYQRKKLEEEK